MLTKVLSAKIAVAAAVLTLGVTGAAAASGSLPDAAQDGLATAASHIGIHLPSTADDHARLGSDNGKSDDDHSDDTESSDDAASADDTESDDDTDSSDGHGAPGDNHGADVSSTARTTDATGADKGATVAGVANEGRSDDHSAGADDATTDDDATADDNAGSAVVETPNGGGTGTAGSASRGASDAGTGKANDASGGHSSAGEGNAPSQR